MCFSYAAVVVVVVLIMRPLDSYTGTTTRTRSLWPGNASFAIGAKSHGVKDSDVRRVRELHDVPIILNLEHASLTRPLFQLAREKSFKY